MSGRLFFFSTFILLLSGVSFGCAYGSTLYVSARGSDSNSGQSARYPLKTVSLALSRADTVFLKAGDVFYGGLIFDGKVLSRYGSGANPSVKGYKRITKRAWKQVGQNVWRIDLTGSYFSGIEIDGSSMSNNICCIHEFDKDLVHGRKVLRKSELARDWDFCQTDKLRDSRESDFDFLYLYLNGNPNDLSLEFSVYDMAVSMARSTIDGVNFMGFGFGLSCQTGCIVRNCRIDAMGGRMIEENGTYICYGNGIEFYVSSDIENCLVEHCFISRCYDCAVTIQGQGSGKAAPRNIIVRDNLIAECCQGWEDFLRNDPDVNFSGCRFEDNVVINSGRSGFGYPQARFKRCHVLGNNFAGDRHMVISGNIFIGGNFYCSGAYKGAYRSNLWRDNVCYIAPGNYLLGNYEGTRDVIRLPGNLLSAIAVSQSLISRYRTLTGDETTKFYVRQASRIAQVAEEYRESFLESHTF